MFNRSKGWAVALLAATFGAGVAAGWAIEGSARDGDRHRGRRGPEAMVAYLSGELGLTSAQRDSVHAVFARHRPAMRALWESVNPRMDSLRQAMRAEIAAQLTPAQQERYRELVAGWERQRRPDTSNAKSGDAK